ncbi:MAG: hypothetical protein ABI823_08250 [Bryobacteraceae bacterium]
MTSPNAISKISPVVRRKPMQVEDALKTVWGRLLIPSVADLFFIALMIWLFLSGPFGWQGLLADGDAGWHIRTGEFILSTHTVPHTDLYSFSKAGAPWFAWEWLSDVFFAELCRVSGGLKGLVLMAGVVLAATFTLLLRSMAWRGVTVWIAFPVAMLGLGASSIHFLARPHIFTLLFLVIALWMIEADRRSPSGRIWWLVPLTILWTNVHGGFLVIVAVLGVLVAGSALEAMLFRKTWEPVKRYAILAGSCAAATLVNPYGYQVHVHIVSYLRSDWIRNFIQEFQSPNFRSESMFQFEALLFLGLLTATSFLRRRRITEALWILTFAHLSLTSQRHIPVFVAITAPYIASELNRWWETWSGDASIKSIRGILRELGRDLVPSVARSSVWIFALVAVLVLIDEPVKWPQDFPSQMFPAAMAAKHRDLLAKSRLLTQDQWADYLIYRNPNGQKVFVDGRSDFFGPELGQEYLDMTQGRWNWHTLVEKNRFDTVLAPIDWPLTSLLKQAPEWAPVDDDGKAVLFVRRRP